MTDVSTPKAGANASDIPALLRLPVQYWKQTVLVIAGIVVLAGGYALYGLYQTSRVEKAESALNALLLSSTKGADLQKALQAMAKTAPAGVRDAVNLELAKASLEAGDFNQAAAAWAAVSASAPGSIRAVAGLGQAAALTQAGHPDKALAVLEGLKATMPKAFAITLDRQLAVTAEEAGQWQKALQAYERMKADGSLQNPGFINARIASLRAKLGSKDAAKTNG